MLASCVGALARFMVVEAVVVGNVVLENACEGRDLVAVLDSIVIFARVVVEREIPAESVAVDIFVVLSDTTPGAATVVDVVGLAGVVFDSIRFRHTYLFETYIFFIIIKHLFQKHQRKSFSKTTFFPFTFNSSPSFVALAFCKSAF